MPRVSRKQAAENRRQVVHSAARLFRERGIDGVSVPELMAEAGLTHGAFYGQFESKDALAVEACDAAFAEKLQTFDAMASRYGADWRAARAEFIKRYTAKMHRDDPGTGCPIAALVADVAREHCNADVRVAFSEGVTAVASSLPQVQGNGRSKPRRQEVLAEVALLVGAVVLSRATKGHAISDEILKSARQSLLT